MSKNWFILILSLFINLKANSQLNIANIKENIKKQSDSMMMAFKQKNWKMFATYMHPKIIELAGGYDKFTEILDAEMKELESLQVIEILQIDNIQLIDNKKSMQCVVQYGMYMLIDSIQVSGVSTNLGESFDKGKTWKFVRNNFNTYNEITLNFPWIDEKMQIPKEEQKFGIGLQDFLKTYKPNYIPKPKKNTTLKKVKK